MPARFAAAAKSGHIRALKEGLSPAHKTERFRALEFTTSTVSTGDLILGDSIVLFEVEGTRRFRTFLEGRDVLRALYVPLTPDTVLVGSPARTTGVPPDLGEAIASASFECFISHERSDRNGKLHGRIGLEAALLSQQEMEEITADLMKS